MSTVCLLFVLCSSSTYACTDFLLEDTQHHCVVGRSMEFDDNLESAIVVHPREETYQTKVAGDQEGFSWSSEYALIALQVYGSDLVSDGMNEKGLSFGVLWFSGAEYPEITTTKTENVIPLDYVGLWLLGTCADIGDVKKALNEVEIWPSVVPQLEIVPPLHISIHDRSGKSLVVEFINGKMEITDNPIGVLTNDPKFDWQLTNLSNYVNLRSTNAQPIKIGDLNVKATGEGSGMLGLPGDSTPPSRFIRTAFNKNNATKASTDEENTNLAFHLLNDVDIPYGTIQKGNHKDPDFTQWVVVKDLQNNKLYYRTYSDLNIKVVDLNQYNIQTGSETTTIPMNVFAFKKH